MMEGSVVLTSTGIHKSWTKWTSLILVPVFDLKSRWWIWKFGRLSWLACVTYGGWFGVKNKAGLSCRCIWKDYLIRRNRGDLNRCSQEWLKLIKDTRRFLGAMRLYMLTSWYQPQFSITHGRVVAAKGCQAGKGLKTRQHCPPSNCRLVEFVKSKANPNNNLMMRRAGLSIKKNCQTAKGLLFFSKKNCRNQPFGKNWKIQEFYLISDFPGPGFFSSVCSNV